MNKRIRRYLGLVLGAGEGHFPLSPKDPKSVVDFIVSQQR